MRTAAFAATTLVAALALGVYQDQVASGTSATAEPCSTTTGDAVGPSSADNPPPITTTWGKAPTSSFAASRTATNTTSSILGVGPSEGDGLIDSDEPSGIVRELGRLSLTTGTTPLNPASDPERCN